MDRARRSERRPPVLPAQVDSAQRGRGGTGRQAEGNSKPRHQALVGPREPNRPAGGIKATFANEPGRLERGESSLQAESGGTNVVLQRSQKAASSPSNEQGDSEE
jgi:hypothetical protein